MVSLLKVQANSACLTNLHVIPEQGVMLHYSDFSLCSTEAGKSEVTDY